MRQQYRLVVDIPGRRRTYIRKRDLAHAVKGVEDSFRDFGRYTTVRTEDWDAWVETRSVGDWERGAT